MNWEIAVGVQVSLKIAVGEGGLAGELGDCIEGGSPGKLAMTKFFVRKL